MQLTGFNLDERPVCFKKLRSNSRDPRPIQPALDGRLGLGGSACRLLSAYMVGRTERELVSDGEADWPMMDAACVGS